MCSYCQLYSTKQFHDITEAHEKEDSYRNFNHSYVYVRINLTAICVGKQPCPATLLLFLLTNGHNTVDKTCSCQESYNKFISSLLDPVLTNCIIQ
jgi:hypothetical protein